MCGYIVCCLFVFVVVNLCVCTVRYFSAEDRPIAASDFARWFIGVQGRDLSFWRTLLYQKLPQKPKMGYMRVCNSYGGLIIHVARALADSSSALATRRIGMCG